ncbi:hypothetical protein [Henriciella algicola]|nr:hypothetical protein [Henriciella algicola]
MPKRYWNVLAGLALLLVLLMFAWGTTPRTPINGESNHIAQDHCPDGDYHWSINWNSQPVFTFSCQSRSISDLSGIPLNGETHSGQMQRAAEADLLAQQQVAHWTVWIGVFTALGLGALVWTLAETNWLAVETRLIGEQQTRAYLVASACRFVPKDRNSPDAPNSNRLGVLSSVEVTVFNSGSTPATNVSVNGMVFAGRRKDLVPSTLTRPSDLYVSLPSIPPGLSETAAVPTPEVTAERPRYREAFERMKEYLSDHREDKALDERPAMIFKGYIQFTDVFGQHIRSFFAFDIGDGTKEIGAARAVPCSGDSFMISRVNQQTKT